jgi:ATP-dependent Zn protease
MGSCAQVRYAKREVDMEIIEMALAKLRVGLPSASLPLTKAKRHLASTLAGRAVAMAGTAGMPLIEGISIKPYGTQQGRIIHPPQDMTASGRDVTQLAFSPIQVRCLPSKELLLDCW